MNNFPAMTEERRQELIAECKADISCARTLMIAAINVNDGETKAKWESQMLRQQVALAALTAEPVAYMYKDRLHSEPRFSSHTRFGNWSQEDINEYEITETKLYTAPPAPVLRVPDELKVKNGSHQSHIDYAEGWADCIDEVKRLNAQPSPPEASNEQ